MPQRPPGRPKATDPKDVLVGVRFTEREADLLQRLAGSGSLSEAVRTCVTWYIERLGGPQLLRDTQEALVRRELRKAKRAAGTPEAEALVQQFGLEDAEPTAPPPARSAPKEPRTLAVSCTPVQSEPKTISVPLTRVPHEPITIPVRQCPTCSTLLLSAAPCPRCTETPSRTAGR